MSDLDLRRMPYADLWLAELGATVPEHHAGEQPRPPAPLNDLTAPDPTRLARRA